MFIITHISPKCKHIFRKFVLDKQNYLHYNSVKQVFGKNVRFLEGLVMKYLDKFYYLNNLRIYIGVLAVTLFLILVCVLAGSSIFFVGRSEAADDSNSYKYYTSLEVEYGDTLWGIASSYRTEEYYNLQDYIEEIKALNGLQSDMIQSGQFLIITYYSKELP